MTNVIIFSLALFFAAAVLEIGGGYLIFLWLRENRGRLMGLLGIPVLFGYGVIQTFQPAHFGRVYAAYGAVFIVATVIWPLVITKKKPDRYEIIGAGIALIGAAVIMYAPR